MMKKLPHEEAEKLEGKSYLEAIAILKDMINRDVIVIAEGAEILSAIRVGGAGND